MHPGERASGTTVALRDGTVVVIRPVRADDEARMAAFHAALSPRSVYQRYFHLATLEQRITQTHLALTCTVDPDTGVVLVAEHSPADANPAIVALGRLTRTEPGSAEIGLLVVDSWHGLGLGSAMTHGLVEQGRRLGLRRLYGDMLADNDAMRALVRRAGFVIRSVPGDAAVLRAERSMV